MRARPRYHVVSAMVVLTALVALGLQALTVSPAHAAGATIPMGTFRDILVDPASGNVLVSGDDAVYVYNAAGVYTSTISGVFGAGGMDIVGNSLWVAETTAAKLAEIDLTTKAVIRHVPTGTPISGTSLATIGGFVFFNSNGTLERLDPATSAVTARGLVLNSEFERIGTSTTTLLTYGYGSGQVTKLNIGVNPATAVGYGSGGENLRQIAVDPVNGKYVYASGAPYYFGEVAIGTMAETGVQYAGTNYPAAIAYSPGMGGLFVGGTQSSNKVFVSKVAKPASIATFTIPGEQVYRGIAASTDGKKVYALHQSQYAESTPTKTLATMDTTPALSVVLPGQVVAGVPAVVTVTGRNLDQITSVTVGGATATARTLSSTQAEITMPATLTAGTRTLTVTTPTGTASIDVSVIANTGATLIGTVRKAGAVLPGIALTLSGGGLASPRSTTSSATGTYSFANIPYGATYSLRAHDPAGSVPDQVVSGLTLVPNNTTTQDVVLTTTPAGVGASLATVALSAPPRDIVVEPGTNRCFLSTGDAVLAFDGSGQLLARFVNQWTADGLTLDGSDLYVNQRAAGTIVRIDTKTLTVTGSWPTTHPTSGGVAFAGGRLWFTNGNDQWVGISSLDPATGAVTDSAGSWYVPRMRTISGNNNIFYAWEQGISSNAGYVMNATSPTVSTMASAWNTGGGAAGSALLNKLWAPSGAEYTLSNLTATGVQYPTDGSGGPVAYSTARSGLLGFGRVVAKVGTPQATHELPEDVTVKTFDAGGDRMFYATPDKFVVWDLHPHLVALGASPVYTDATTLTVQGSGLTTTANVLVDGVAKPFTVTDSEHLSISLSALTPAQHKIQVVTDWGASNELAFSAIVRPPAPTVSGLDPSSRPTAGGAVTITGSAFQGATAVYFGNTPAASFAVVNDTTITATAPIHAPATVMVSVVSPAGASTTSPNFSWVAPVPGVTSVVPSSGPMVGGTLSTISGSGFLFASSVTIGGSAASFSVTSDSSITITTPPHAAGTVPVVVTTPGGPSPASGGAQFTYTPMLPVVSSLNPAQGPVAGGYLTVLTGTRFTGATNVSFGLVPSPAISVINDTTIVATVPSGVAGPVSVYVTSALGTSVPGAQFVYVDDGATFHGISPTRLLDSRTGTGGWNGKLASASARPLKVAGTTAVPAEATAVVVNLTVTGSTSASFLTAYPAGTAAPIASNLNFASGQTIANLATVRVGTGGNIVLATAVGATDVVADVVGYYSPGSGERFNAVAPSRALDSRTGTGWSGKLGAGDGNVRSLPIAGGAAVPATATSVVINVTVTEGDAPSFLQVWPAGSARPSSSNVNFAAGQATSNLVIAKLGTGGALSFFNAQGSTHVVADVVGYFDPTSGSIFHPLAGPTRFLDDRINVGAAGPWGPGVTRAVTIGVGAGVPIGATGLVFNATVTGATAGSFLSVFPTGPPPTSSTLNFAPGQTVANLVMVGVPPAGSVSIFNQLGSVDVVGDAVGYFAAT